MLQISIHALNPLASIFTGKTLKKTISLLLLIKKNMLKLWCYLQAGPCWDYLYKWQRHAEIPDERAKSRACFCPRLQLSLTNLLLWSWVCSILWFFIYFKYFSMLLQRPVLVPWANQGANHKVLKWHSAGGKKALDKRKCTQRGNPLDTIVFPCLARLFMHESCFLLFLEICQAFQIFQPLL